MALTEFTNRLGKGQGRIPDGTAPEQGFVFALGDRDLGHYADLRPGDYVQVTQRADLTNLSIVRVEAELRVPKSTPSTVAWQASLLVDGAVRATAKARAGQRRQIRDLAARVSGLTGLHDVAVRLELTE